MQAHVTLKKREERRLLSGHLWIFSNEISSIDGDPATGDVVGIRRHDGKHLGVGFFHPHSLIAVRFLSPERREADIAFFRERIGAAVALRDRIMPGEQTVRLVHGESDLLPGLIVDRYGPSLSVQTLSAGMDVRLPMICDVLEEILHPACIIGRNDAPVRALEHLPQTVSVLRGSYEPTAVSEHGLQYSVNLLEGQKTGLFLDQKLNRLNVRRYSKDRMVLDCFCNDGGFAMNALTGEASTVEGIDISSDSVQRAAANASANALTRISFTAGDVFDVLRERARANTTYDLIILDPPSFTKSKKTLATALHGYRTINTLALRMLRPGGILVTASCSHHVDRDTFQSVIQESAVRSGRAAQLLEFHGASPDHPVHPAMPETSYLKLAIVAVP